MKESIAIRFTAARLLDGSSPDRSSGRQDLDAVAGQFASPTSRHQIYEQGIATLALCEAYQMTHDKILEKSCQAAVQLSFDRKTTTDPGVLSKNAGIFPSSGGN